MAAIRRWCRHVGRYALPMADFILTVRQPQHGGLIGFATLLKHGPGWRQHRERQSQKGSKWIELDLVCAWDVPGLGTRGFVREIERFAKSIGADGVDLHAIPKAITFYRSLGYSNTALPRARSNSSCQESPAITKSAQEISTMRFPSDTAAVRDPKFAEFLKTLVRQSAAHPRCRGIGLRRPQCSFYGYPMFKCL